MQLLLILALLLFGGRNDAGKLLKEFRPVLEQFGGDDVKQALKSAEELQGVISALGSFGAAGAGGANMDGDSGGKNGPHAGGNQNRRTGGGNTAENKNTRTYAANNGNSYGFDGENVKDAAAGYGKNYGCSEPDSRCASSGGKGDGAARSYTGGFPLAPVAGIADKEILYRLVRCFSEGVAAV